MAEQHTAEIVFPEKGWASLNAPGPVTRVISSDPEITWGKQAEMDTGRGLVRALDKRICGQKITVTFEAEQSMTAEQKAAAKQDDIEALKQIEVLGLPTPENIKLFARLLRERLEQESPG